ncbi:MAG: diguanylate cyclase, partial [Oxalobacter sp.]|nr:diguanylate cyclase [Oxalobacter sp.]
LRELLVRTLSFGLATLLHDAPELANEAENLGEALKTAQDEKAFEGISKRLNQLCFKVEMKGATSAEQQELLLRLFRLLLNNIGELLEDDNWLRGQIDVMQELISGPVSFRALEDTETNLKEVIYKQGLLKHSLNEAKESMKQMMISFIERLGFMTESTGNYHDRIKGLSEKISKTDNVIELNSLLETIMYETNAIQTDTLVSLNQMQSTRKRVEEAETRVRDLEGQLEQMSELVREDMLTGSLNRRGLEDAFDREIARAERQQTPLCVAMLDLDNFKILNDTHGHLAGDDALIHLVRVVKQTLRPTDVIARYGGEEFVILFPETQLNDAIFTMQRLQRELTKHFFMHNNERILITFSAGVALHKPNEDWDTVTHRADKAMYAAKKSGKNRVLAAE